MPMGSPAVMVIKTVSLVFFLSGWLILCLFDFYYGYWFVTL
tara:strand:- start:116 stop:238 length:123 start_codon:yes stop_codon:yes gene_type:complete